MSPEKWEQVSEIYFSALKLESGDRAIYLEKACAGDDVLRREVESLLSAEIQAGDFITEPLIKDFPALLIHDAEPALTGKRLGHYQIISHLASGGMGEVYLAKDLKLNRSVALKTLPRLFSTQTNSLRRFENEVRAAATLNHPNIATIYSVEEADGQPFFTMEYVEGKTLDALIPKNGLDHKTFLEWFVPISAALSHAHEKGIIHRDIKPGNIMITAEGVPKILDFGLAQIDKAKSNGSSSTLKITNSGQILGTPSYMSPEQAEGKQVDNCSDIFSLGVVMYEAIAGERPFKGDNYASLVSELMTKEPPSVTEIKSETPFLLSRLIARCLKKERRRRFGSMREVRVILEEIQAAVESGVSTETTIAPPLSNREEFMPFWLIASMAAIIAIAGFAVYYSSANLRQSPISFENATLRKLSQTNNVVYAHIMPEGKSVAYKTIEEDEKRALWIRRIEEKNVLQLLPPQPIFFWGGLTPSFDGSQIYYIAANRDAPHGTLYRISSLGGAPRKLVETVNDLGSLSPEGGRILYVRYGKQMELLSANASDGGDERVIHTGAENHIFRDPQFSLDGKSIYFIKFERIAGDEFWSLVEIPASGGAERVILPSRKPKINEIVVLKDKSGLLINAVDSISNLAQLFHVSLSDGKETRVTNDLNGYFGISVSDDCKTIVSSQRNKATDVWVSSNKNFSNFRKLTNESNINTTAVWTPDGRIVYDAVDNNRSHVWIMNGDGSNPQQLSPNSSYDFEPQVSPDGRYIVFTSERTGEKKVWRMNIDGSNPQLLTPVNSVTAGPVITPDGQTVLFSLWRDNKRVLGKVPLAGGTITEQPLFSDVYVSLSPDGKLVAYSYFDEQDKRYKVRVRPINNEEPSTTFNISPLNFLLWTVDGKGLLYRNLESNPESDSTVWLQPIEGGEPKPFLSTKPDGVFKISQSYDGKQVAVIRGRYISDAVMLTNIAQSK